MKNRLTTKTPLSEIVEIAREHPDIQASIGWSVLTRAYNAGAFNLQELFRAVEQYEQLRALLIEWLTEGRFWVAGVPEYIDLIERTRIATTQTKGEAS